MATKYRWRQNIDGDKVSMAIKYRQQQNYWQQQNIAGDKILTTTKYRRRQIIDGKKISMAPLIFCCR
jgi:hypothetical protein